MTTNLDLFLKDFNRVKDMGFVLSRRQKSTGIGKTFEDIIGILENNNAEPDLHGFEIKSQRYLSQSYVTLFTKAPTMPKNANTYLRVKYGSNDKEYPDLKVLHTSIFYAHFNTHISGAKFSLNIDENEERLYILVQKGDIVDRTVYYSFDNIRKGIKKLENLAYVTADKKIEDNCEYFKFRNVKIFYNFISFENFLDLIKNKVIMYDVRVGAYKMGQKKGKTHDHGSGFRVKRENMGLLYEKYIDI